MKILDGFSLGGYRSFGENEQVLTGLEKINIIIGQNNSGKSNIVRCLVEQLPSAIDSDSKLRRQYAELDAPKHYGDTSLVLGLQVLKDSTLFQHILQGTPYLQSKGVQTVARTAEVVFSHADHYWFYLQKSRGEQAFQLQERLKNKTLSNLKLNHNDLNSLFVWTTNMHGGDERGWTENLMGFLDPFNRLKTKIDFIPATRSTKNYSHKNLTLDGNSHFINGVRDHSGIGLIEELQKLQNPQFGGDRDRERFEKINTFIKTVTGNGTAQLEIPHDASMIIVNLDDKRLPLDSLGSGIEEMIIIAVKSTIFEGQIVCIEEPELHLHPALQKKLLRYLYEKTNNQYFVTTHSAHLMDVVPCSVHHVKLVDGYSRVDSVNSSQAKFSVCRDLGYRASDIIQSNCIIWVEGPSDRTYLNHWLRHLEPDLIEGLHYSVMFYGGRLLSHLSAMDDDVTEFISLKSINRNMAILIDSDKNSKTDRINQTKQRIKTEFEASGEGIVWVSKGREIENYISLELYEKITRTLVKGGRGQRFRAWGQFEDLMVYDVQNPGRKLSKSNVKKIRAFDKVKFAQLVANEPVNLDVLDLRSQLMRIVSFVNACNEHSI